MSSLQLQTYLALRAAETTMTTAAMQAGIPLGEARLIENDIARGEIKLSPPQPIAAERGEPIAPTPATTPKETTMGTAAKAQTAVEVKEPDFAKAVRIFRADIKPANEKSGEHAQAASTGYKAIKKDCHVNTRAAKFVFQLAGESEEKRNDVLRSIRGLLVEMGIGVTDDLVSRAEGENADGVIPNAAANRPVLATVN